MKLTKIKCLSLLLMIPFFFVACENDKPVTLTPHKGKGPSRNKISPKGCLNLPSLLAEYAKSTQAIAYLEGLDIQSETTAPLTHVFATLLKKDSALLREGTGLDEVANWNPAQIQQLDCDKIQLPSLMGNAELAGEYSIAVKTKDSLTLNKGRFSDTQIVIEHQENTQTLYVKIEKSEKFVACQKTIETRTTKDYSIVFDDKKIKSEEVMISTDLIDVYSALINNSPIAPKGESLGDLAKKNGTERVKLAELRPVINQLKDLELNCDN